MQQASYLEGGPLVWMLPLYLHVNQKSDYDDMMNPKTTCTSSDHAKTPAKFQKVWYKTVRGVPPTSYQHHCVTTKKKKNLKKKS